MWKVRHDTTSFETISRWLYYCNLKKADMCLIFFQKCKSTTCKGIPKQRIVRQVLSARWGYNIVYKANATYAFERKETQKIEHPTLFLHFLVYIRKEGRFTRCVCVICNSIKSIALWIIYRDATNSQQLLYLLQIIFLNIVWFFA